MQQMNLPQAHPSPPPDDEHLAVLLESIRPRPSGRFYRRMAASPWKASAPHPAGIFGFWPRRASLRGLALIAVLVLVSGGAFFAFPSLGVFARQLMQFFSLHPTDRLVIQVTAPSPGDPSVFGTPTYFNLTLPEAEAQAGWQIARIPLSEITALLPGLELRGVHYDPQLQTATLHYAMGDHSLFLSQHRLGQIQVYNEIAPGALVEKVRVRGVEGEFVAGGWKAGGAQSATPRPGAQLTLDVAWDPDLPQRILRWQEGDFLYEILSSASLGRKVGLGKEELITIAEIIE